MQLVLAILFCPVSAPALLSNAQELPVAHGARFPAVSPDGSKVAFSYRGDLWVCTIGDRAAARLTVHEAFEYRPAWSPDGRYIAFTSDRYGNNDVFVVPAEGGNIVRLTYHSANDRVADWSADGRKLLIASDRDTRFGCPYVLDIEAGRVTQTVDDVYNVSPGTFASNGRDIVLSRKGTEWWRIGYRGATNSDVFLYDAEKDTMERLTDFDGRDEWPMLSPDDRTVYFVSEREGPPNLFAIDRESREVRQVTKLGGDGVMWPSISEDGKTIVFEHDYDLYTVSTDGGEPKRLLPRTPVDARTNDTQLRTLNANVDEMEVSPDGKYLAVRVEGDILLIRPEFKDDSIRLTDDPAYDGDFMWSPDSKHLVYTSTRTGNSDIFVADVGTRDSVQLTKTDEYEHTPKYDLKGKKVYFTRTDADGLYRIPAEGGDVSEVHSGPFIRDFRFSPCGHWILLMKEDTLGNDDLWIMPIDDPSAEVNITKYPGFNGDAWWEPNGERIFFLSSRDGGSDIYSIRLTKEPEKFEDYEAQEAEKAKKETKKGNEAPDQARPAEGVQGEGAPAPAEATPEGEPPKEGEAAPEEPKEPEPTKIDFEDIELRVKRLTSTGEAEGNLTLPAPGDKLVYTVSFRGEPQVWQVKLDGTEAKQFVSANVDAGALRWTASGDKLYYVAHGRVSTAGSGGGVPTEVPFKTEFIDDRKARQVAAFEQAWQALDERFYDPAFHGADWGEVRERYAKMVDGTLTDEEFNFVMSRMCGELNASHLGCYGGGRSGPETGRLGLWFDESYDGPGLKVSGVLYNGPCTKAESVVAAGEYVLGIDGHDIGLDENTHSLLEGKVGKRVKLTVNAEPKTEGARTVSVKPIGGGEWGNLRYEQWVRECRDRVKELSGGRLYYMHIRGMSGECLERFRRELFGEAQRYEGVVLDIRYNGGGRIHDQLLEELMKGTHVYENLRNAPRVTQPIHLYEKPIVLVINEQCASDAEIFPNGFRTKKLGTIVGMQTYGGVIGTYDITLVNGHGFRVPVSGWHTLEGANLENYGVKPDIEAPFPYEAHRDGRDPQLEAAAAELLARIGEVRK